MIFFSFLHENICCGYSLEVPHRGTSNEYHNICFYWKIRKKNNTNPSPLIWSADITYSYSFLYNQGSSQVALLSVINTDIIYSSIKHILWVKEVILTGIHKWGVCEKKKKIFILIPLFSGLLQIMFFIHHYFLIGYCNLAETVSLQFGWGSLT